MTFGFLGILPFVSLELIVGEAGVDVDELHVIFAIENAAGYLAKLSERVAWTVASRMPFSPASEGRLRGSIDPSGAVGSGPSLGRVRIGGDRR